MRPPHAGHGRLATWQLSSQFSVPLTVPRSHTLADFAGHVRRDGQFQHHLDARRRTTYRSSARCRPSIRTKSSREAAAASQRATRIARMQVAIRAARLDALVVFGDAQRDRLRRTRVAADYRSARRSQSHDRALGAARIRRSIPTRGPRAWKACLRFCPSRLPVGSVAIVPWLKYGLPPNQQEQLCYGLDKPCAAIESCRRKQRAESCLTRPDHFHR